MDDPGPDPVADARRRAATSFDVAARAGVSQSTVSRALRGGTSVNAATRSRVERVARELNYQVDKRASTLRRGRTGTIALLFFEDPLPDGSGINPFFLSMLGPMLRASSAHRYDLICSFQHLSDDWALDFADSHKADGFILLGYGDFEDYRGRIAWLAAREAPFVRWGSPASDAPGIAIGCDNRLGGRVAAEHLLARGRRRLAFLGATGSGLPEFRERHAGMVDALRDAGIAADDALRLDAAAFVEEGHAAARRLIASGVAFDAAFAACDSIAIGAMRAFGEAGIDVPGQVSVVGFDGIPMAAQANPALTTIDQDFGGAGEALVEALLARLSGGVVPDRLIAPRLVVRASS